MNKRKIIANILLILTAFIWGSAFVAQSVGMDKIPPFAFNAVRFILGGLSLLPVILICNLKFGNLEAVQSDSEYQKNKSYLWKGGILCGIFLFAASYLQNAGLQYTTAGKAGFITALYIIFVPLIGLFFKKKVKPAVWVSIIIAMVGLYFLCINETFSVNKGDFYVFLCSLPFAGHILLIDKFSPYVSGIKMSCIQFFTAGILSLIFMLIFEKPEFSAITECWLPLLYIGIMSCGVAYTLQIIAQKNTSPAAASLLLSTESVFAVISGMLILQEKLNLTEITGCILMFAAVIITEIFGKDNCKDSLKDTVKEENIWEK